jgi:Ni,Fe-hydrogenase I large subunit
VKGVVDSGQLSLFASGYWGHPAYHLPPEVNLLAVAHYLEALAWQKDFIRIHAVLGGKNPHPQTFLVGGMTTAMDPNEPFAVINPERIDFLRSLVKGARKFVEQVYVPDVLAIAPLYKDWFSLGEGVGNFLSYGDYSSGNQNDPKYVPVPARHRAGPRSQQGLSGGRRQDHRVRQPLLVRVFGRRQRQASRSGRRIRSTPGPSRPTTISTSTRSTPG